MWNKLLVTELSLFLINCGQILRTVIYKMPIIYRICIETFFFNLPWKSLLMVDCVLGTVSSGPKNSFVCWSKIKLIFWKCLCLRLWDGVSTDERFSSNPKRLVSLIYTSHSEMTSKKCSLKLPCSFQVMTLCNILGNIFLLRLADSPSATWKVPISHSSIMQRIIAIHDLIMPAFC